MPLPTPVGRQREVLALRPEGHVVVLGTAGSGKTTLAILRAVYLANPNTEHHGKTLLVTFNRTLVTYLRHLGGDLGDVTTETYHTFALGYLASQGRAGPDVVMQGRRRDELIATAVEQVAQQWDPDPFFTRPLAFYRDEIAWIARHGCRTVDTYQTAASGGQMGPRAAQGLERAHMFEIYERYRTLRVQEGKLYDWDDMAMAVSEALDRDRSPRRYRHVVIDEGQDFSPEMIRSLVKAVPPDGSVTLFVDAAQQIYGHRVSWRDAGLQIDEPWEFRENYRNTAEIARLGLAISRMPYYRDLPDLVEPTAPNAAGPPPTLVECASTEHELRFVIDRASRLARAQTVAILMRNHVDLRRLVQSGLPRGALKLDRNMRSWQAQPGLRYGTYHSAKGLEFDAVFLPFLSAERLPDAREVEAFGEGEAATKDGRLLYVAVTRAKTRLVMTHSGPVTPLLPADSSLYSSMRSGL